MADSSLPPAAQDQRLRDPPRADPHARCTLSLRELADSSRVSDVATGFSSRELADSSRGSRVSDVATGWILNFVGTSD
jgi:hypothetical protein